MSLWNITELVYNLENMLIISTILYICYICQKTFIFNRFTYYYTNKN